MSSQISSLLRSKQGEALLGMPQGDPPQTVLFIRIKNIYGLGMVVRTVSEIFSGFMK